ncbi:MAG TPA: serine hydrolase [Candidatus Nitrosotalea sp.]|nr:serine hydrolase [Candidatus Nitrosotalea sp.]
MATVAAPGLAHRPGTALRVATGLVSHTLCSDTFVAGLDPTRTVTETFHAMPGIRLLMPLMRYHVDRARREVRATVAGLFESRAAYRPGMGCTLVSSGEAHAAPPASAPSPGDGAPRLRDIAGPAAVEPADERLRSALDRAFADPPGAPARATKAVVVVHDDRIVAERYAPGYGIDTPLLGWSMTKSVVNALIGILVRQGRLSLAGPAPVPAWRDPSDPRHAITVEQLMRMTSGLALDETNNGFDPSSRMLFTEPDMAGFAERAALLAPPGTRYHYSSPSTIILSRIIRDAVGGRAEDVVRFADRELFGPLGMRRVTLEFDGVGTPVGSSYMYATARDWARFGLLYAHAGVVGGVRILPEGWVDYSASWTPGSRDGYGAGFFTNRGASEFGPLRIRGGMPPGSFFASGTQGQRIVVAPAERLVVVRLGRSQDWETFDIRGLIRLVADANAVVNGPPR